VRLGVEANIELDYFGLFPQALLMQRAVLLELYGVQTNIFRILARLKPKV
jgi:hypothetical protein